MLDAWVIAELRRKEQLRQEHERRQPQLEIPLPPERERPPVRRPEPIVIYWG
jgi:hypothetical protein